MPVTIKRKTVQFNPDPKRVITRFFWPGENDDRARVIIQMVMALPHEERTQLFNQVLSFPAAIAILQKYLTKISNVSNTCLPT